MVEVVEKVREGFENMKLELDAMKLNIQAEKETERIAFEKALEEKYADRSERIDKILSQIVYTEEIEVLDPAEQITDESTQQSIYS